MFGGLLTTLVRFAMNDVITSVIATSLHITQQIQITRMIYPDSFWLSLSDSYLSAPLLLSFCFSSTRTGLHAATFCDYRFFGKD